MNEAVGQGVFKNFFFSTGRLGSAVVGKPANYVCTSDGPFVFDLSSMTKALAGAPVIYRYLRQKNLTIEATLERSFPKACRELNLIDRLCQLKIINILEHEAGFRPWINFFVERTEGLDFRQKILNFQEELFKATLANEYSDVGHIILSLLLETELSTPTSELFSKLLKTEFGITQSQIEIGPSHVFHRYDVVSTGYCQLRGRHLRGEVHDENCSSFGGFTLHSGLFGSGKGVEQFLEYLFSSSFGQDFIHQLKSRSKHSKTTDSCFGWRTGKDAVTREFFGGDCVGHYGFTGCAFWINLQSQTYVILLTDRVSMSRTENLTQLKKVRTYCFQQATKLAQLRSNE